LFDEKHVGPTPLSGIRVGGREFVCLNALISGTTGPIRKILSVSDSPFIEEGYSKAKGYG
jgi:hypothetical protein